MQQRKDYLENGESTFYYEHNSKVHFYFWQLHVQTEINADAEIEDDKSSM